MRLLCQRLLTDFGCHTVSLLFVKPRRMYYSTSLNEMELRLPIVFVVFPEFFRPSPQHCSIVAFLLEPIYPFYQRRVKTKEWKKRKRQKPKTKKKGNMNENQDCPDYTIHVRMIVPDSKNAIYASLSFFDSLS